MSLSRTVLVLSLVAVILGFAGSVSPAHAQTFTPGVRAGASVNPDQFYIAGHLESSPLIDRLRFRPNAELGFGDDVTLAAFNFEFIYPFPSRQPWHLYVGAGPALNYYVFNSTSDLKGGFNFLIGAENRKGLFAEMKIGAIDSPDLKFGVGYTFR